jgi:hypothetical protein
MTSQDVPRQPAFFGGNFWGNSVRGGNWRVEFLLGPRGVEFGGWSRLRTRSLMQFTEFRRDRLEVDGAARYHPVMLRLSRFSRLLLTLAALCVMYAGPVAACVCAMDSATDMPCCPDQQGSDQSNCIQPDAQAGTVCDPVPAHALTSVSFDLSLPAANFASPLALWSAHGPPTVPIPIRYRVPDSPPIYLVTLRLRN